MSVFSLFSNDIGIDLGTANTLVHVRGRGIVIDEPSVVAVDTKTNKVSQIGTAAKSMLGRTPGGLESVRPMRDGVIADFDLVKAMIKEFIDRVHRHSKYLRGVFGRPRVVIGVPSGITEVERRAVVEAAQLAGAREVHLVAEPMAAAIGMGIPIGEPSGNMVIDIGGGTSEIAVIALYGIVCDTSVRTGGDAMDKAITAYLRRNYNLLVGPAMAEQIKMQLGSAYPLAQELSMEVKGRDVAAGIPRVMRITSEEIREALEETLVTIVGAVKSALEQTPPELSADILDKGIVLTGGGAQLRNLDERIRQETNLPVNVIDNPLQCVCMGAARIVENIDQYRRVLLPSGR